MPIPTPELRFCQQQLVIDMAVVVDTGLQSVLFLCGLGSCRDSLTADSIFKNYRIALNS